ncbi:TonB-dependent receptor plug domain-containing protein [Arcticibacter eurypsychrophilus]|uniref:TonB-dependent receptor plug domain-containing protein n=1 Tax=Arcticibacter eurypsychrophilus TaxID=1434752 RepID=UPI00084D26E2|nr:TonB-dependent receptor [Arcticibacter eurypsychrophilus]
MKTKSGVRNYFKKLTYSVSVLLMFLSAEAFAQADTSRTLKEVNVSTPSIPQVQTVNPSQQVNSAEFKRYNAFNVADAIKNFSGVSIKDYGGIGGLKTVSVRSLGANHTGVLYDGVQLTDAQNGQIDLGTINLDNVESITLFNGTSEVICQPARSFASSSVLMIKTVWPRFEPHKPTHLSVTYKTGSFGLTNPSFVWQQQISKQWSFSMANNWQKANGRYKYKVNGDGSDTLAIRNNANLESLQSNASLFWSRNDSNRFHFRINYYRADRGLPGAVVYYNPTSNQHLWNRDLFLQSGYEKKWGNGFHLLLNAKYAKNYIRYLDPDFLNEAGELNQKYTQTELYQSAALSYKPFVNWEISYSSDMTWNRLKTNLYQFDYPERFTYLNVLASRFNWNKFVIQGNLLNTHITEHVQTGTAAPTKTVWSPALSATYKPSEHSNFLVRAFYKDIFRNPTFNDLYYTRLGNRTLKPEYAKQVNLGVTYSKAYTHLLNYLTFTADAYYNRIDDKIIAIPNKDLFTWTMLNLGKVEIKGLDLGIKTELPFSSSIQGSISGNYTYQNAIDVTDPASSVYLNQIPYTPEHSVALNAGIHNNRFSLYYNQIVSSSRYYLRENLPENYVPGFTVSDASASYQFFAGGNSINFSTELNNIFNNSYAFIRSFPMPGRSVRFSLQIKI